MDRFGEITVARVSHLGQKIYTVIFDVLREGIWIRHSGFHYVIPRETTTVTYRSFKRYNIKLQKK